MAVIPTQSKKMALMFHAKNDLPEVRRKVFKVLPGQKAKVHIVIQRKDVLGRKAHALCHYDNKLRWQDVYDDMVICLFPNLFHKADENHIAFVHRGKLARKEAL